MTMVTESVVELANIMPVNNCKSSKRNILKILILFSLHLHYKMCKLAADNDLV